MIITKEITVTSGMKDVDDMKKIWKFFENLDEYMYVADMDTHEIVYMNRKTLATYGFHSLDEVAGKKCYQVLQNSLSPCAICNNDRLEPQKFREWKYYNPILKAHMFLKDTMMIDPDTGRRYRVELAMDVGRELQHLDAIENYQNMEYVINEGLRVALSAENPDRSIEILLEYLGKTLGGERTYIFEKNKWGRDDNTYEWVADGVEPEKDSLQNLAPDVCGQWYSRFRENENIIIRDLEELHESDPVRYGILKRQNIHSLIAVPLFDEGKVLGFFGMDNPDNKVSLAYAQNMLQVMGYFLVTSMRRRNLIRQLRTMSYTDPLTKMGNRFAMEEYAASLTEHKMIGVVFCDITGLKRINDEHGHLAGDKFIQAACACIRKAFGGFGLFRIGGDELLVLCYDISEQEIKERVAVLRKTIEQEHVTLAIGYMWKPDTTASLDELMTEAERWMYEDKAEYYRTSGLDRRR